MKLLLIALLFFTLNAKAQSTQDIITFPAYVSYWNHKTLIPDSVIYTLKPHTANAKRFSGFHTSGGRINMNRDYNKSGYDKGHLADASDMDGSVQDEFNSFDQCNIFPQVPNNNRITWLGLENRVRKISKVYKTVKVKISWIGVKTHIGVDNVTVPLYCVKEIWYTGHYEKYTIPNQDSVSKHPFTYYLVDMK